MEVYEIVLIAFFSLPAVFFLIGMTYALVNNLACSCKKTERIENYPYNSPPPRYSVVVIREPLPAYSQ